MKKLLFALTATLAAAYAQADVQWSWWLENQTAKADISLGLVTRCANIDTLEISALYSGSPVANGLQWSVLGINDSATNCGLQLSCWFNRGNDPCAQIACVNVNKHSKFNFAFINFSDTTAVQIGLLNFNKNGFLPLFPFINLDKSLCQ